MSQRERRGCYKHQEVSIQQQTGCFTLGLQLSIKYVDCHEANSWKADKLKLSKKLFLISISQQDVKRRPSSDGNSPNKRMSRLFVTTFRELNSSTAVLNSLKEACCSLLSKSKRNNQISVQSFFLPNVTYTAEVKAWSLLFRVITGVVMGPLTVHQQFGLVIFVSIIFQTRYS